MRVRVSIALCASALAIGLLTAFLASRNRARANELDRLQHWCETFSRRNELLRGMIAEEEWELLRQPANSDEAPVLEAPEF